jgi:lysophospholipase
MLISTLLITLWPALPLAGHSSRLRGRDTTVSYAPRRVNCPTNPLIRPATSLSQQEASYYAARKNKTDTALAKWLHRIDPGFKTTNITLPSVVFAGSGGGYRAALNEAGIIQALDSRDSNSSLNGLYQALTYHGALSGGAWLLMLLATLDWTTISIAENKTMKPNFADGLYDPDGILVLDAEAMIGRDLLAKLNAGYPVTFADAWSRLVSWNLFDGPDGGLNWTLSSLASLPSFVAHDTPYPIITAIGDTAGVCAYPVPLNSTQYELTPYEIGSWDAGVKAFVETAYLGSNFSGGVPSKCVSGFDNLGFLTGASSNILFGGDCAIFNTTSNKTTAAEEIFGPLVVRIPTIPSPHKHTQAAVV